MSASNQSQIAFENDPETPAEPAQPRTTGILPSQEITNLIARGHITATPAINPDHIQPASLDLRLGDMAHRVRASFLPGPNATVADKIKDLRMTRVDLTAAPVFEKDCVYIVPLVEELSLPDNISGRANPKSTTGRLDIFTRLITDYGTEFDSVPPGYKGKLYAEVVSRTFTVAVRAGMRLSQLRFVQGSPDPRDMSRIKKLDDEQTLVYMDDDKPFKAHINRGLRITLNLEGAEPDEVIAYRARHNAPVVELDKINHYPPAEFWESHRQSANKNLILHRDDFYILASRERVRVPPDYAAVMLPFDTADGEFRIHYAGFFDPGFGYGSGDIKGTRAVLEVRAHEVPFLMEHGQLVGRLNYMHLLSRPEKIYGTNIGSSYQHQALTLSKQFRRSEH